MKAVEPVWEELPGVTVYPDLLTLMDLGVVDVRATFHKNSTAESKLDPQQSGVLMRMRGLDHDAMQVSVTWANVASLIAILIHASRRVGDDLSDWLEEKINTLLYEVETAEMYSKDDYAIIVDTTQSRYEENDE